jgi:hypothetical protein
MPLNIKSFNTGEYHYARVLTMIATNQVSVSSESDEPRQKRLRSSNACSKLCANQLNLIISFCVVGEPMVAPETWRIQRALEVPVGTRVLIMESNDTTVASPLGLVGVKTHEWEVKLDVRATREPTAEFALASTANFVTCFNIEKMPLEDVVTVASALNMERWMQFGFEGFNLYFPTPRQQSIVFYVCGCYCFVDLKKKVGPDPRFAKLFPYAVAARMIKEPDESINTLPTHVCAEIKAQFTPSQFRYFLKKYHKSPEQELDKLFPKA